jgi:ribosomal protein S18 acetylase RimI-like enzyme
MTVIIKPAAAADVLLLQQLSIDTFTDTYGVYNTPENMRLFIEKHYSTLQLLHELADNAVQYYLAFNGKVPAGYMKLRTGAENPPALNGQKHIEIERIYVLPAFKGQKIGKQLVEHACRVATQQGYQVIWLGVWEENKNACAFYNKQGFVVFGEHAFVLGTEAQRDWLMKKDLQ